MNDKRTPWWATTAPAKVARQVRRPWKKAIAVVAAFAILYVVIAVAANNPGRAVTVGAIGQVTVPPTMSALAVGCSGVTTWPNDHPKENGYLADNSKFVYRVVPAPYGNYAKTPWTGPKIVGSFGKPPTVAQAVNLEYHGWTVVWYSQDAGQTVIDNLFTWGDALPANSKVLIAPWPSDPTSMLQTGRVVILTKWETTQACLDVSDSVYGSFISSASKAPGVDVPLSNPGPEASVSTDKVIGKKK